MSRDPKADLRTAAAALYRGSQPKLLLAQVIIDRIDPGQNGQTASAQVDSCTAASMLGMSEADLLQLMHGDPCLKGFRPAGSGPSAPTVIKLDTQALLHSSSQGHNQQGFAVPSAQPPHTHHMQQQYAQQYGYPPAQQYGYQAVPQMHPAYPQQYMQQPLQHQQQYMGPPRGPPQQYYPQPPAPGQYHPQQGGYMQAAPPPPPHFANGGWTGQAMASGPGGLYSSASGSVPSNAPGGMHSSNPGLASTRGSSRSSSQTGGPSSGGMAAGQLGSQPPNAGGHMGGQSNPAGGPINLPHGQLNGQSRMQPNQAGGQLSLEPSGTGQHNPQSMQQQQQAAAGAGASLAQAAARAPQEGAGPQHSADGSSSSTAPNAGKALLAKLQHQGNDSNSSTVAPVPPAAAAGPSGAANAASSSSSTAVQQQVNSSQGSGQVVAAGSGGSSRSTAGSSRAAAGSSSSSSNPQASATSQVDPKGVYIPDIPGDTTAQDLRALFADAGSIVRVDIVGVGRRPDGLKSAFVNFVEEASAHQVLSRRTVQIGGVIARILPKTISKAVVQEGSKKSGASSSSAPAAAAAGPSSGAKQTSRVLGRNEEGLPQLRGVACCPYYMGTGECQFRNNCKYHHPSNALHPVCLAAGKMPHRYNAGDLPSYARLVNFTERLWDYGSCVEAQLKIWLARHLLASENSGCGMFDESAAVPAAPEYHDYPEKAQPLGPYSCTLEEAEQVLQVLWKAQPDEAAKQEMPYKGRAAVLFSDNPYYELAPDTSGRKWIQLKIAQIKGLLNY